MAFFVVNINEKDASQGITHYSSSNQTTECTWCYNHL